MTQLVSTLSSASALGLGFAPAFAGFGTGAGLIVAIGAQNAYVLRQGVARRGVAAVVLVCLVSDAVLIAAGVAGVGAITQRVPWFLDVVRWAGVVFLVGYALLAARRALRPQALEAENGVEPVGTGDRTRGSLRPVVLTAVALTWLNPHVYLDTMVLVGSIAATYGDPGRWVFGLGAVLASAVWFPLIGYGAGRLAPVFAWPAAWRVLDGLIALQLLVVAVGLAVSA